MFRTDIEKLSPKEVDDLIVKWRLPGDSIYAKRDEVFADLYAHLCGAKTNNPRSNKIREVFNETFAYLQSIRKDLP